MWSIIFCALNAIATLLGWIVLVTVVVKLSLGPKRFKSLRDKVFALFMEYCAKEGLRKAFEGTKKELFSSLKTIKSCDPEMREKNALKILEVGVGTGTNLEYYPAGSRLLCVDPNGEFEAFFRRECERKAAHLEPDIRFVVERGESMPSVADGSMDVVVITLVLCGVTHLDQMFREVRRVLTPGGKFYFLEHVGHAPGTWRRRLQDWLSNSGFWPAVYDGCVLNRDPEPALLAAGFSRVDMKTGICQDNEMHPLSAPVKGLSLVNPIMYGTATK